MRILFVTVPVAGHTLPLVPLAWAVRLAGHEVLFATGQQAEGLVVSAGIPFVGIAGPDIMEHCLRQAELKAGIPPHDRISHLRWSDWQHINGRSPEGEDTGHFLVELFGHLGELTINGTVRTALDWAADAIVYDPYMTAGLMAAKVVGIPAFLHGLGVTHPSRPIGLSKMSGLKRRFGVAGTVWEPTASINPCPTSLRPGFPDAGWPMRFIPYNGGSANPLNRAPGRKRVCVTMGTAIPFVGHTEPLRVVLDAVSTRDVDVIALGDTSGIRKPVPDNVQLTDWLPLNTVLSTCSAVIHHGGSGTTFATLAAGLPQLVIPQFADQPVNAEAIASRGAGIQLSEDEVSPDSVRDGLDRLFDEPSFSRAAREVRDEMAAMPLPCGVVERLTTSAVIARRGGRGSGGLTASGPGPNRRGAACVQLLEQRQRLVE